MIFTKTIEVGINIQNCINLYTDPDNIKQILVDRYEGRCFGSCFIKKIEKIKRVSECVISQDGAPSYGSISVICEVTAIAFASGEVINGCTVINRDKDGMIICATDIAKIILMRHPMIESVSVGQIISVRVAKARYNNRSNQISVSAVPFIFNKERLVYKIGEPGVDMREFLANVLDRIKFEEAEKTRLKDEKAWKFFDELLYAYKERAEPKDEVRDMNSLLSNTAPLYIGRDPKLVQSSPNVCVYTAPPAGVKLRDDLPTSTVLLLMFEDYCAHLRTIREMIGIYSSEELLTKHRNVWQIFAKNKLS